MASQMNWVWWSWDEIRITVWQQLCNNSTFLNLFRGALLDLLLKKQNKSQDRTSILSASLVSSGICRWWRGWGVTKVFIISCVILLKTQFCAFNLFDVTYLSTGLWTLNIIQALLVVVILHNGNNGFGLRAVRYAPPGPWQGSLVCGSSREVVWKL